MLAGLLRNGALALLLDALCFSGYNENRGDQVLPKSQNVEAIFEEGVFKPLQPINDLREHQRVTLTVTPQPAKVSDEEIEAMLELAFETYEGLSEEQIRAIEAARLDQEQFFKRPR